MNVVGVTKILTGSRDRSIVPSSFDGLRPGGSFQEKQRRGNVSPLVWTAAKGRSSASCSASLEDVWAQVVSKTDNSQLAFVLVFSAFPFVAVKAIANSGVGSQLNDDLEKKRPALEAEVTVQEVARERARLESPWYGERRPRWLGPIPYQYPTYLDGTAAGDYGFDLLGLAKEKKDFDRYLNLEVLHGRWAMLGALGALVPELLARYSDTPFLETLWWNVGYAKLLGDDLDYLGIPGLHIAGGQGIAIIAIAQFLLMLGPEYARATGIRALEPLGVFLPGDINYPGSWLFDPLGLSKNARLFEDLKVREMKNGRLAMVAWVGFAAQAAVTKQGLLDNWFDFLADPEHANVFARYLGDLSQYPTYVALKASITNASGALQAQPAYQEVAAQAAALWGDLQSSPLFQVLLAGVGSALFALSGGLTGAPAGM